MVARDDLDSVSPGQEASQRAEELASGMVGQIADIPVVELCQMINSNQKTGVLKLEMENSRATLMLLLLEALLQSGFSAIASRQQTNRVAHHNHLVVTQPCRVFQY